VPALKNHRHEKFAQALAAGKSAAKAYVEAGYKPNRGNAVKLKRQESILQRVTELEGVKRSQEQQATRKALKQAEVTAERIVREMAMIAYSDPADLFDFTGDEYRLKPPREVPERARRAMASIKVKRYVEKDGDEYQRVEVLEFKLWDKLAALKALGQHLGLFVQRHEVTFAQFERLLEIATDELRKRLPPAEAKAAVVELVRLAKDSYGQKDGEATCLTKDGVKQWKI